MQKVAFLTTIFPTEHEHILDFFDSLEQQTFKNFDIVVVNDGYENFEVMQQKYQNLSIIELPYKSTPANNRAYGINYVKEKEYDILIFGDSDDYFENNRIEKSIELLQNHDIVINDLSLFNTDGIFNTKYLSNRIENYSIIHAEFIMEKNIFGLSNTAIKLQAIDNVNFDSDLIAVDWYFFSILLLNLKRAIFTNETQTFYRQYSDNTIGIGEVTIENLATIIKVKHTHYRLMKKHHHRYEELYKDIIEFKERRSLINLKNLQKKDPFWWELNQFSKG